LINSIVKYFTGKEIILYDKHRQTQPLANNPVNKKNYYFFEVGLIWQYIPFKTSDKRKHKIMYFILNCIQPKYILSMNWQTQRESLYKVWTAKHSKSKFIVMQHGAYVGGVVTDIRHKYTKCDIFLTWGCFFVEEFKKYNSLKKVEVINFGNSLFNQINRENFNYKETATNKILFLPTALNETDCVPFYTIIDTLENSGFQVHIKTHGKQGNEKDKNGRLIYPKIERGTKVEGNLYALLEKNDFDFIISDHSSALLDAIFFKNKVLYFDPNNNIKGYTTHYSSYLNNLYLKDFNNITINEFYNLINTENQEALFANMVSSSNNELDGSLFINKQ
jgi:hypothetical protein